jgi:tetratricopeptide (TPR) repeat protein
MEVKVWQEKISIPTYGIGNPEKNPIFLEKRVYQGSTGVVYPYPVIEKILDEKTDKEYLALYLENDYLKIMILPELGGRVQMAFDKTMNRHFIYYNEVIKPALVGLTGPWISGGIEFNWPQHHRPNTYGPVDFSIEDNPDGSKTAWVSELERMSRTKMMAGFTLHPGKAYLEIRVRLFNRTPVAQTFLWWANPAVKVNDYYQSVFPPDVNAVFDHGKRDVSKFPIADGTYYKVDYSAGVDISQYKNIPVPTSYMAINSEFDFLGGYEHDTKGGVLHVANHHISPGKKQWTWGNGDFGQAWDRNLTDSDGPYIELMAGVFTDNQPDFSWMQPYEERTFEQYFMPYKDLGLVKNASIDAAVTIEQKDGKVRFGVYTTSVFNSASVILEANENEIYRQTVNLTPLTTFWDKVEVQQNVKIKISVLDSSGSVLVSYQPVNEHEESIPEAAKPAKEPEEIRSIEQLYLTGLHLEQYRHATFDATDYYREALKREPGDIQNNNALGLWLLKRGQFAKAELHFRAAIKTLTERNPNPSNGEPFYNLGLALEFQEKFDEAFNAYYKASWNEAWQASAYFNLARLAVRKGDFASALPLIEKALIRNWHNHKARHLKVMILRILEKHELALQLVEESLKLDQFNMGICFEDYLINRQLQQNDRAEMILQNFLKIIRDDEHNYIEYSIDYGFAGRTQDAIALLSLVASRKQNVYPMVHYFMGYYALLSNDEKQAKEFFAQASKDKPGTCFPNRLEDILVLQKAIQIDPSDAKASFYLGNLWYDKRQFSEAIKCWENSAAIDPLFPTVLRNLALAYYNKKNQPDKALDCLERAFTLDKSDARVLMELDQLYKKLQYTTEKRLALLEQYPDLVESRDDLYLELITLYNWTGKYEKALKMIASRKFHPWEGGEGKVIEQYKICRIELAKIAISNADPNKAIQLLRECEIYPHNLGEGKLYGTQENDIHYFMGLAFQMLSEMEMAQIYFEKASNGLSDPTAAIFYNDQQPDKIFYQGLAWLKLGNEGEAKSRFAKLIEYGETHISDKVKLDYFAVSLPDLLIFDEDLTRRNIIHCYYLIGLGNLGLGLNEMAENAFNNALEMDSYHWGATLHKNLLKTGHFIKKEKYLVN